MTPNNFPLTALPVPYEIVWCRFPHHDTFGNPGPYPRPALVRNTATLPDGSAQVEVVYGTTNLKLQKRPFDLFVTKMSEMDACGLFNATRFDLDCVIWLPWNDQWFDVLDPHYASPVIGKLTDEAVRMLQMCVSFKQRAAMAKLPPSPSPKDDDEED